MRHTQNNQLTPFIEAAKSKGISDEYLTAMLVQQGWPKAEVFQIIGAYWEQATGMAVPERAGSAESSRDTFLYLLSFATLATWASAFGSLMFRFIEYWVPDPVIAVHRYNLRGALTWQMASMAVAFPIFLLVMRTILREAGNQPERLKSGMRKWLTYIALFLTAGGVIGDLICFLDYFLTGELTARFVLKVTAVLIICGAIFFYYLRSLQWDEDTDLTGARVQSLRFGTGSAVAVVAAFCVGLGLAGSPSSQRHLEADNHRVQDLREISNVIASRSRRPDVVRTGKMIPSSLNELSAYGLNTAHLMDPETNTPYEYRPQTETAYELCARFAESSEQNTIPFWYHQKGRSCFSLDASAPAAWSSEASSEDRGRPLL